MKKYVMTAASALTLASFSAQADTAFAKGIYVGAMVGYTQSQESISKYGVNDITNRAGLKNKGSAGGFDGSVLFGYQQPCYNMLLDIYASLGYNSTNLVSIEGKAPSPLIGTLSYKPRAYVGLGARIGYLMGNVAPFVGVALKGSFGQKSWSLASGGRVDIGKESKLYLSVMPEVGVKVAVNENVALVASVGYEMALGSKLEGITYKNRFSSWAFKVGVQYSF